ncbi:MAG: hypothetical protein JRG77_09685 [Deltaproteobacteria bacterium]|nr:hypothetical protein [Deltaproteobacteria bacterium]
MNLPNPKQGDLYLLFHHLPYDFSAELPLAIGLGVCLDNTPQEWLDSSDQGLADYLLPGYSLSGMGLNNCCLRCFYQSSPDEELSKRDLLFFSVLALRLQSPIGISIGGEFRVGDKNDYILAPTLYEISSSWNGENCRHYTPETITAAGSIADRLVKVKQLGLERLQTSLIFFSHVTIGFSKSFQLSYLGLFASLEALFVPSGNKAATLSRRVSNFLSNFQFPEPMEKWIKDEYINGRHKLAHGIHDAAFGATLSSSRREAFGRLHEITRLSLLGFLSLDDKKLNELSKDSGNSLQKVLDNLGGVSGPFLRNQEIWLG